MTRESAAAGAHASTATVAVPGASDAMFAPRAIFHVVCTDANGVEKWREDVPNVVTTLGKNDLLDKYFRGSSYTAVWYCMLLSSTPTVSVANTMASHAWTEVGGTNAPAYTSSTRPALTFANAASAGSLATSSATSFSFSSGGTVGGMAATTNSTKDNTGGILYNAVAFTGGDRAVVTNDVVNVSVTYTIT